MIAPAREWTGRLDVEPPAPSATPSVVGVDEPPFERKFVVTEAQAAGVVEWAVRHLAPDPHSAPGSGGVYRVASLYLDTANLDIYHRRGTYGRAKYRLGRYMAVGACGLHLHGGTREAADA